MRFSNCCALIATAYLAINAKAAPAPKPVAPTYQVVDVGGPTTTEDPATVYETVNVSTPPQTVTQYAPTVTATPDGPIIPHVETSIYSVASTPTWTVTIGVYAPEPIGSSTTSSTSSCTSSSSSTSSTTTSWVEPIYNAVPAPYSTTSAPWNSTLMYAVGPTGTGAGFYAPYATGSANRGDIVPPSYAVPWNTADYTRRGFAAPSGVLPSSYAK